MGTQGDSHKTQESPSLWAWKATITTKLVRRAASEGGQKEAGAEPQESPE